MAQRLADGTVVLRTKGRVAYTPSGSGTAVTKSPFAKPLKAGPPYIVSVQGQKPAPRSAYK